jgi:hypothetical protein
MDLPYDGLGSNLSNLSRLSNAETRSISAENVTGAKGQAFETTLSENVVLRDLSFSLDVWFGNERCNRSGPFTFSVREAVARAVRKRIRIRPPHNDRGIVRQPFYPDIAHGELHVRSQPGQAREPPAQRFAVMALSTERMCAAEAVMNVGNTIF